jgi:adenylate cyclase
VMWQWGEQTTILEKLPAAAQAALTTLELVHEEKVYTVNAQAPTLRIGRDRASEVVLAVARASRGHARVEFRKGKFYLADHSSNGTFVRFHGEEEVRVSREEIALTRSGEMSFGEPAAAGEGTLRFEVY